MNYHHQYNSINIFNSLAIEKEIGRIVLNLQTPRINTAAAATPETTTKCDGSSAKGATSTLSILAYLLSLYQMM